MGTKIQVGRDTEVVVEDPGQRLSLSITQARVANAVRLEQDDSDLGERLPAESTGGKNRQGRTRIWCLFSWLVVAWVNMETE